MQRALVPYVPPREGSHRQSFAEFVRSGGGTRVRPMQFGGAVDEESTRLLGKQEESEALKILRTANRQARATQCAVILVLLFAVAVFSILGILAWQVRENLQSAEAMIRPHAAQIVNTTLDAMKDLGSSLHHVNEVAVFTNELASVAGGTQGSASRTLNSTAEITAKLSEFLSHPTLSISLGGGAGR